ncbi:MAG: Flp pilus assembly protein CpaB [Pseudomonadota bacterium]
MGRLLVRLIAVGAFGAIGLLLARGYFADDSVQEAAIPAPAPVTTVSVVVALQPLAVGTFLDAAETVAAPWPRDELTDDVIRADGSAPIAGAVVIRPVEAGAPLRSGDLLLPGQDGFLAAVLAPGKRAVSIAVDAVSGNAGHVFPGDVVDLILTLRLGELDRERHLTRRFASETVLQAVRVIAVDQSIHSNLADRDGADVARTLTLEVSPREAEWVAVAEEMGSLSVSLRSLLVPELEAEPAGVAAAEQGPTWASDVSAVVRAAAGVEIPTEEPAPVIGRQVRVLRGSTVEVVEN